MFFTSWGFWCPSSTLETLCNYVGLQFVFTILPKSERTQKSTEFCSRVQLLENMDLWWGQVKKLLLLQLMLKYPSLPLQTPHSFEKQCSADLHPHPARKQLLGLGLGIQSTGKHPWACQWPTNAFCLLENELGKSIFFPQESESGTMKRLRQLATIKTTVNSI